MTERRRLTAALILTVLVTMFLALAIANVRVYGGVGRIDLFTQKEPFSGKGPNAPSDAFAPGETVFLYALVEYNGYPLQNLLVTFFVKGPDNFSFSLTASTNASGIASINFTIPQKCPPHENETFGEWFACANVRIGDIRLQDALTFKVGWIVELLGVRTLDGDLAPRDYFGIGGDVGLEISLKNIAKTEMNATLAIVMQDELGVLINSLTIDNIEIQPNEKTVFLYAKLNIPKHTAPGKAKVYVSAFKALPSQNEVAYCPPVSTDFIITIYEPIQIEFHDAAVVKVAPSTTSVRIGEPFYVSVKVRNEGTLTESFNVSLLVDNQIVGTLSVLNLTPYSSTVLNFTVDTRRMAPGSYLISAFIHPLLNEADVTDNTFTDGYIELTPPIVRKFLVTFEGIGLSPDAYGVVLTVNGSTKIVNDLPYSLLVEEGSVLSYTYEETVLSTVLGKRFRLRQLVGPSSPITVRENITIAGDYKTQYYLLVSSPYGSPTPQSGWFDAGTTITASVISPWPGPEGTRYMCVGWVGTGSVPPSGSDRTVTFTINQPSSITWLWKTQYYLTVVSPYGVAGGEGWYDANETAYASLNIGVFDHGNGTRRVFVSWGGDASGTNYARSNPIVMNAPKTAVANWKTQYYLSLQTNPSGIATPTGEGWYDSGTYAAISTPEYVFGGSRFRFVEWTTADMTEIVDPFSHSTTVFVDKPKTVTANYVKQYQVTFTQTGLDSDASGTVATVNGTSLTFSGLPYSIWVDENSVIVYSYESIVPSTVAGKRFILVSTMGPPSPTTVTADLTIIGKYKTQYLLTVVTDPAGLSPQPTRSPAGEEGPANSWWYDARVNVSLFAPSVSGYDFVRWVVDGTALGVGVRELVVFMDGPHTAIAHYSVRVAGLFVPGWFYWILLLILVLIVILLCLWIYRRRRRAKTGEAAFRRGWTAWYYGYDLLGRSRRLR